jgi:hypothetical protein
MGAGSVQEGLGSWGQRARQASGDQIGKELTEQEGDLHPPGSGHGTQDWGFTEIPSGSFLGLRSR